MPEVQSILFSNGRKATVVHSAADAEAEALAAALSLPSPRAVLLSIGGADALSDHLQARLTQLYSRGIARAAIEAGALIIDGGTQAGVMALMGEAVASRGYQSQLLGVAPAALLQLPGSEGKNGVAPEPNHSHFVLTEGEGWGSETATLFKLVRWFSGAEKATSAAQASPVSKSKVPVIAILTAGGTVSRQEALMAVRQNIPLLIIEGSGGAADEIAAAAKTKNSDSNDPLLAEIIADGELHFHHLNDSVRGIERLIIRELGTDKVLLQAWETFASYDLNANQQQAWFTKIQTGIIVIGVATTTLVVIQQAFAPPPLPDGSVSQPGVWKVVHYLLILLPILLTVLMTASNRFKQGSKWLLLRAGAESIKREIFVYRVRNRTNRQFAEQQLAKRMEDITRRTMQTEVNLAALKPYNKATGFPPYTDPANGGDDGFSPLTPERYVEVRLTDQLNYYSRKAVILEKQLRVLYWCIFIAGGLGAFLAAVGQQLWIAFTTALIAALGTYLGFRQTENTLIKYNQTSTDLANIRAWWNALTAEQQAGNRNIDLLVKHTEQVLQTELDGWMQRMQNALADLRKEQQPAPGEPEKEPRLQTEEATETAQPGTEGHATSINVFLAKNGGDTAEENSILTEPDLPLHQ